VKKGTFKTILLLAEEDQQNEDTQGESETEGPVKSLLEGNGFRVLKKIGTGSYSKVKVTI